MAEYGYAREEYGLFEGKPITREEFDDGSAVIGGEVVRTRGAKLRSRYLTPYNFVVAAKLSPYNSRKFDGISQKLLNGLLSGELQLEDSVELLLRFPRHDKDGDGGPL
jgi:hypothetical protein